MTHLKWADLPGSVQQTLLEILKRKCMILEDIEAMKRGEIEIAENDG